MRPFRPRQSPGSWPIFDRPYVAKPAPSAFGAAAASAASCTAACAPQCAAACATARCLGQLSTAKINALIADAKSGKLTKRWFGDGGNLLLHITNGAGASWVFRYDGRRFSAELMKPWESGSYADVDLDTACERAHKYRLMLADGKDPKADDNAKLDDQIARGLAKTVIQIYDRAFQGRKVPQCKSKSRQTSTKRWF